MASTVNPFSIGVASGEAGVSIGDGIVLRFVLWVVLTAVAVVFVIRYARRVQQDRARSLVGFGSDEDEADTAYTETPEDERRLTGTQKWVLAITAFTFGLMIFSVIPWSAIFGATTTPADYDVYHETATEPYWFELNWWFPQLAMLFIIAAIVVGVVARMGEKEIVSLITRGRRRYGRPGHRHPAGARCLGDHDQHPDPRYRAQRDGGTGQRCVGGGLRGPGDDRQHPAGDPDPVLVRARDAGDAAVGARSAISPG